MSEGSLVFQIVVKSYWSRWNISTAKNYHPVSLLSVVSKVFEKLVNNRLAEQLEKCGLFSDFQYCFRTSQSTVDLLIVVSYRIARAFNRSGVLELKHFIYPRLCQDFTCWSSSQTQVLPNFRSGICSYFLFPQ